VKWYPSLTSVDLAALPQKAFLLQCKAAWYSARVDISSPDNISPSSYHHTILFRAYPSALHASIANSFQEPTLDFVFSSLTKLASY
jgi:hypothetical protein